MKNVYSVALCLVSTLSFCSWEPGSWKPETSPTQTPPLASNIWYLQSSKQYRPITTNNLYVCVIFYDNTRMDHAIDQVAQYFPYVIFLKVNVNKFPQFKEEFKSLPAICLYKKGDPVYFKLGSLTAQKLTALLKNYF